MLSWMSRIVAFMQLGAILLLSISIVIGYGVGLTVVLYALSLCDVRCRDGTMGFLGYAPYIYTARYEFLTSVHGPDFVFWSAYLAVTVFLVLFAIIFIVSSVSRFAPTRLSPIRTHHALPEARQEIRSLWRDQLRLRSGKLQWLTLAGCILGFTGAWVGLAEATIKYHIRCVRAENLRLQWAQNAFQTPQPPLAALPGPVVGTFNIADGAWIFGGAGLLSACWVIVQARRRLVQSGVLVERWCLNCGHDIRGLAGQICPECGKALSEGHMASLQQNHSVPQASQKPR